MIDFARDAVVRLGLASSAAHLTCNVFVLRQFVFEVFVDAGSFYHVKLGRDHALDAEFRAMREAHTIFPDVLPTPLGLVETGAWQALVSSGVSHDPVSPRSAGRHPDMVVGFFANYLRRAKEDLRFSGAGPRNSARIASYASLIDDAHAAGNMLRSLAGRRGAVLDRLAAVRQHGDLARANVGMARDSLYIFDWEDFGVSHFAALDVCVFLCSMLDFRPELVERLLSAGRPRVLGRIKQAFCEIHGIDADEFAAILPAALLEFLFLKRSLGYGEGIRRDLQNLIVARCNRNDAAN